MPPSFFPAILIDAETEEEFFCRSVEDIPDGRYVKVKECGLTPMLCKCELTDRYRVVYKSVRCEPCHTHEGRCVPLNMASVEKMLEDINDYINTMETLIDKWRPRTA